MSCPLGGQGINPSWWLTLLSSCLMGLLECPLCPGGDGPMFPPGLSSPTQWGDAKGLGAFGGLLLSAESRRGGMSTSRVWQEWWQTDRLIDTVSAQLEKHENSTTSLQSLVPSRIPCTVAALCSQTKGPSLSGISVSSLQWKLLKENIS